MSTEFTESAVAIIGMHGRFPGCADLRDFWAGLARGFEPSAELSDAELTQAGVAQGIYRDASYVRRSFLLSGAENFDAGLFGFAPRDAAQMDPQHRILLECAWASLEDAGYDPTRFQGRIGAFVSVGTNSYFLNNLVRQPGLLDGLDELQRMMILDKEFIATRLAYKLNLRGPAVSVQTACSSSLVATHLACQSLLAGDCDMVLVGGSSLRVPQHSGYLYQPGSILSPDGHCRAFDTAANGTVPGSGAGVIVLKLLRDALRDRDSIRAVILGSAINNDGALKIGYTAPSVAGQAQAIADAHAVAGVSPEEISYIEAHGTGTALGDPIEIAALTEAFRRGTKRRGYCSIGSVKTNIGHLDAAAGIAGLLKVVLSLQAKQLAPSLNFREPNPAIDFESSPFFVQRTLSSWDCPGGRRVAGVSSFGIGGTNAHVVLTEPPPVAPRTSAGRKWHTFPLSAKTPQALERISHRLANFLGTNPEVDIEDLAFTLQLGRKELPIRRTVVADTVAELARTLAAPVDARGVHGELHTSPPELVFMFPAQGAQQVNMGRDLYESEPVFRDAFEKCRSIVLAELGVDLAELVYPPVGRNLDEAAARLAQTVHTQPAVFAIDYALACLWMSWGIKPTTVVGHSLGEYVAATLAGVFTLEGALKVVVERARLMQALPPGRMIAVRMSESTAQQHVGPEISLAAINAPELVVLAGPVETISTLESRLRSQGVTTQALHTSHAFHSLMMQPAVAPLVELVRSIPRKAATMRWVSTLTGQLVENEQACDPEYWGSHLVSPVRFADAVHEIMTKPHRILLEVGPGTSLTTLARANKAPSPATIATCPTPNGREAIAEVLSSLGRLWECGVPVDWVQIHGNRACRRIPLPTYAFEAERHWFAPQPCDHERTAPAHEHRPENQDHSSQVSSADNSAVSLDPVEEVVARVWSTLLGVQEMAPDSDFFHMGGDSLLAIHAVNRANLHFGVKLPLASLIAAPTVKQFARLIRDRGANHSRRCLVPMTTTGGKTALFLMHSHGGNILEYMPLARALSTARPVYALQARGVCGEVYPTPQIEEMARAYLAEIRDAQPDGPYLLGGYCFGGHLAIEAAHQLRAAGAKVASVVLFDAPAPSYPQVGSGLNRVEFFADRFIRRIELELAYLADVPSKQRGALLLSRVRRMRDLALSHGESAADFVAARFGSRLHRHSLTHHLEALASAHDRAWAAYQRRPYNGRVLFVRAARQPHGIKRDPLLGWGNMLEGETRCVEIPGHRQNLLGERSAAQLARLLADEFSAVGL